MNKRKFLPLTGAADVLLEVSLHSWGYLIGYAGSLARLRECGCISDHMREFLKRGRRGRARYSDEHGDRFYLHRRSSRRCPDGVTLTRYVQETENALALPGVAEYLKANERESGVDVRRFRQHVSWKVVGNVIALDLKALRARADGRTEGGRR